MSYNYLHSKLVPTFIENYQNQTFCILVKYGIFYTRKHNGEKNIYTKMYQMYVDNIPIKYSKFYKPKALSDALKINMIELETFYVYNIE